MKRQAIVSSDTDSMICPRCGIDELERGAEGAARCARCDRPISAQMLRTLEQIVSLSDAIGNHACECGHPEMRRLPDGVLWCPGCGSEVLPLSIFPVRPEMGPPSEAYLCGWTEGHFGRGGNLVHNEELAKWEDAHDRLDYYRGHRAGRSVRPKQGICAPDPVSSRIPPEPDSYH